MAVSITKYPGGLEYPTAWTSSIKGLTPTGTYVVSFEEALKKFPGLEYSNEFQEAKKTNTVYGASASAPSQPKDSFSSDAPSEPSSVIDIQIAGPETGTQSEELIYNELGQTYDEALEKYEQDTSAYQQKSKALQDQYDADKAYYLSGLQDPAEIKAALSKLKASEAAVADYALSFLNNPLKAPDKSKFNQYKAPQSNYKSVPEQSIPQPKDEPVSQQKTPEQIIEAFENKLLDQAKGKAVEWPNVQQNQEIAQADTSNWPSIKDRQEPPIIQPGTGWPTQPNVPPTFRGTPSGTYPLAKGPKGEQIASILPPAMTSAELQREINSRGGANPGTKEYGELRDLQKEWIQRQKLKGAEAPFESGPDKRFESAVAKASAAPEEQKFLGTFQSEYDPQKAKLAATASKSYKTGSDAFDPFKSSAFG